MTTKVHILSIALVLVLSASGVYAGAPLAMTGQTTIAPLIEEVTDAVVNISVQGNQQIRTGWVFRTIPRRSVGSGVIIDEENGYIVTNQHVIDQAQDIYVALNDGRELEATVVGTDVDTDIAVLQIEAKNLKALKLADSDKVRVGDFVVAIGSPFGLRQTVTSGIVSALGRTPNMDRNPNTVDYENYIQTDAAINPGNSGGPLMNFKGEIIGINTAIGGSSRGSVGIGLAIPSNMVDAVTRQLIDKGVVERGFLGIAMDSISKAMFEQYELESMDGVVVASVIEGSGAEQAGLEPGDVIIAINEEPLATQRQAQRIIGLIPAGESIDLKVIRDGNTVLITAVIGTRPSTEGAAISPDLAGATFRNLDRNKDSNVFDQVAGFGAVVESVDPDSMIHQLGIKPGDVILRINREPVGNATQLDADFKNVEISSVGIYRDGRSFTIPFPND